MVVVVPPPHREAEGAVAGAVQVGLLGLVLRVVVVVVVVVLEVVVHLGVAVLQAQGEVAVGRRQHPRGGAPAEAPLSSG